MGSTSALCLWSSWLKRDLSKYHLQIRVRVLGNQLRPAERRLCAWTLGSSVFIGSQVTLGHTRAKGQSHQEPVPSASGRCFPGLSGGNSARSSVCPSVDPEF